MVAWKLGLFSLFAEDFFLNPLALAGPNVCTFVALTRLLRFLGFDRPVTWSDEMGKGKQGARKQWGGWKNPYAVPHIPSHIKSKHTTTFSCPKIFPSKLCCHVILEQIRHFLKANFSDNIADINTAVAPKLCWMEEGKGILIGTSLFVLILIM